MMIDCHSHILPHFDDGAKTTETALEMLSESFLQGVTDVISTSHCYPKCAEDIADFIAERNKAFNQLKTAVKNSKRELPKIYPAAEVNMLTDVSEYDGIADICINNTDYVLIEMPMTAWKDWMTEAVYKLTVKGYRPVIAHIDRYLSQEKSRLRALDELEVVYQINTDAFIDSHMRNYAFEMIEKGRVHLLGTDMHNLKSRKPNMKEAADILRKNFGEECLEYFTENARAVLNGEKMSARGFKRKSFLERLLKK